MPGIIDQRSAAGGSAPSYEVPKQRIVSIEHPCVINAVEDGFKSLGGEHRLRHLIAEEKKRNEGSHLGSTIAVSLRPDDPFAPKIPSTATNTRNLLVKVTLPKRTGRKRKRGSDEPFRDSPQVSAINNNDSVKAGQLLRRMRDNESKYRLEAVGVIEKTHRFTQLPDYQARASEVSIMREIQEHAIQPQYENFSKFHVDLQSGSAGISSFPGPPTFIPDKGTIEWTCRTDDVALGPRKIRKRRSKAPAGKARQTAFMMDRERVPQAPPPDLDPPGLIVQAAIDSMKEIMAERPIITIRAAAGLLKDHTMKAVAQTIPYMGYFVRKGPWCDTIIKYGLDPRLDPMYRKFQTMTFRAYHSRDVNAVLQRLDQAAEPHEFNGKTLSEVSSTWQLCDLTDPLIREILDTENIRSKCDDGQDGWFFRGTIAKARIVMREKMKRIVNQLPMPDDDYYRVLSTLPNRINGPLDCRLPSSYPLELVQLADDVLGETVRSQPSSYKMLTSHRYDVDLDSDSSVGESEAEPDSEEEVVAKETGNEPRVAETPDVEGGVRYETETDAI